MKQLESTTQNIALDLLVKVENFRTIANETEVSGLMEDIHQSGLETPLVVFPMEGGTYEIGRGHRRTNALRKLKEHDPARFDALFGDGVPCEVYEGLTAEQKLDVKADIGNSKGLNNPYELQLFVSSYLERGCNEGEAVMKSKEVLDSVYPPTKDNREKLEGYKRDAEKFRKDGFTQNAIQSERDAMKHYKDMRRGVIQGINALYRGPIMLLAAMHHEYNGELPAEGHKYFVGNIATPKKFTLSEAKRLARVHQKENKDRRDSELPVYTKAEPGPIFLEAYAEWCNMEPKKKAASPKSLTYNELEETYTMFTSPLAQMIIRVAQKQTPEGLAEADREAYLLSKAKVIDPKGYKALLKKGEQAVKEQASAQPAEASVEVTA